MADARQLRFSGNRDACQAATTAERIFVNARHALGDRDARQAGTITECRIADTRHALGDRDARQAATTGEPSSLKVPHM